MVELIRMSNVELVGVRIVHTEVYVGFRCSVGIEGDKKDLFVGRKSELVVFIGEFQLGGCVALSEGDGGDGGIGLLECCS